MRRVMNSEGKRQLSEFVSDNLSYAVHLYQKIRVNLTDGKYYEGWLKCVDPVTGTLILIILKRLRNTFEVTKVFFVQKAYILTVDVLLAIDPEVKSFLLKLYAQEVAAVHEDRRDRLVAFIKAHRMPAEVSADGRNISTTGCTIEPPYTEESCMGSNAMVVFSVGKVIKIFDERSKSIEAAKAKSNEESDFMKTPTDDDVKLKQRMQNLKLAPAQADLSAEAVSTKKNFLSDYELLIDESSDNKAGFIKNYPKSSSGESSAPEESYEFISKE